MEILYALGFVALVILYPLPTVLAQVKNLDNLWEIAVINFFLGWTTIGWLVALVMGLKNEE